MSVIKKYLLSIKPFKYYFLFKGLMYISILLLFMSILARDLLFIAIFVGLIIIWSRLMIYHLNLVEAK